MFNGISFRNSTAKEKLAILLAALLILFTIMTAIYSLQGYWHKSQERKDDNQMAVEILDLISDKIRKATETEILDVTGVPLYNNVFKIENGKLLLNGQNAYEKAINRNRRIEMTVKAYEYRMDVTITLLDDNNYVVGSKTKDIRVNALKLFRRVIEGKSGVTLTNPVISFDERLL